MLAGRQRLRGKRDGRGNGSGGWHTALMQSGHSRKKTIRQKLASRVLEAGYIGNQPSKKLAERTVVLDFLRRLGVDLEQDRLTDHESPDFLVQLPKNKVGLEVTNYHWDSTKRGSKRHKLFEQWRKIALALRRELSSHGKGLEFWYGAVHFRSPYDASLDGLNRSRFIRELIHLAEERLRDRTDKKIVMKHLSKYPCLQETVHYISCMRTSPEKHVLWWHASLQSGPVGDPIPVLHAIIEEKDRAAKKYRREGFNDLWLLVFARAANLSESAVIGAVGPFATLRPQALDRVFFWDKFSESVWELWPRRHALLDHDGKHFLLHVNRLPEALKGMLRVGRRKVVRPTPRPPGPAAPPPAGGSSQHWFEDR